MSELEASVLNLHGHEVRYLRAGDGPPMLLVHGIGCSSTTWKPVFDQLAEHYTVLAPDLPGHGRSDKPRTDYSISAFAVHLRDFLVATGIEKATIVGHSLGGGIAMQLAYQHPDRVDRLVLVASGGLGREVSLVLRAASLPGAELVLPLITNSVVRDLGNAVSGWLRQEGVRAPGALEAWRGFMALHDPRTRTAFLRTVRSVIDLGGQSVSAHDRLYLATQIPLQLMWGTHDGIIPIDHAYTAHEAMPGSRLEIFENAGHFLYAEQPERFVNVLHDFMQTTEPAELDEEVWQLLLSDPVE